MSAPQVHVSHGEENYNVRQEVTYAVKKCSESTKGCNSNFNQGQPWTALETTFRMAVESLEFGVGHLELRSSLCHH